MVMPLSRYLSGDFISPTMAIAWEAGVPYSVFGPEGRRDVPKDTPFGGPDAPANRARFVTMLLQDLENLPSTLPTSLWDEASSASPTFHRVDPTSYGALLAEANARTSGRSLMALLKRKARNSAHVAASVFLPISFEQPFDMPVVFERVAGSASSALRELEADGWTDSSSSARDTLSAALHDAVRLRLPMIVDT